jgi:fructose-1,6-bisphosphatase/inositol monophosphatase family enzyme
VRSPSFTPHIGERGSHGFMKHTRKLLFHRLDAYVRDEIDYWDLVPPMLLLEEAGCVCLDREGQPILLTAPDAVQPSVLVCHPSALNAVLQELRKA